MYKKLLIIGLCFLSFNCYAGYSHTQYLGNKLLVLNNNGFFIQLSKNSFKKIILGDDALDVSWFTIADSVTAYANTTDSLYRTTDQGKTWKGILEIRSGFINFESKMNVIALLYSNNELVFSTNKGVDWSTRVLSFPITNICTILIVGIQPPDKVQIELWEHFASYHNIYFYKSTPPYNNWINVTSSTGLIGASTSFDFVTETFGYQTSENVYSVTTNGGTTWIKRSNLGDGGFLMNGLFLNFKHGYLYLPSAWGPGIYQTTNGGYMWNKLITTENVASITATDSSFAYTHNNDNLVYVTNNNGVTWEILDPFLLLDVDNEIQTPNNFTLYNNYPNPFNPSTVIKFAIPERNNVKINVYDLLGKQIALITDKVYDAGTYEITFNTESINGGLSAGIYFYTMQCGNNVQTKKMILVK